MYEATMQEVIELTSDEASEIGGQGLPFALYLTSCFSAGFDFGYSTLGPALFG